MNKPNICKVGMVAAILWILKPVTLYAAFSEPAFDNFNSIFLVLTVGVLIGLLLFSSLYLYSKTKQISATIRSRLKGDDSRYRKYIETFDSKQIDQYFKFKKKGAAKGIQGNKLTTLIIITLICLSGSVAWYNAQDQFGEMPAVGVNNKLKPAEIAAIMNHERTSWGNNSRKVTVAEVDKLLKSLVAKK